MCDFHEVRAFRFSCFLSRRAHSVGIVIFMLLVPPLSVAGAQDAARQAGDSSQPPSTTGQPAADFVPPSINLIGLADIVRQEITAAYEAAKAAPTDAKKLGELGMLYTVPAPFNAAECFAQAARLEPGSFRWKYYEGLAHAAGYRHEDAAEAFRQAAKIDPAYAAVYVHLGDALLNRSPEAAEDAYRNALKLSPRSAKAHFGLGECARRKEDRKTALQHYREAVALAPMYADAHAALASLHEQEAEFRLAQAHRTRQKEGASAPPGDDPLLIELYTRSPDGTQYLELIDGLAASGHASEAVSLLHQAVERNPKEAALHHALAVLLNKLGRYREAAGHFRIVLELAPAQMETLLHLSQTLLQLHEYAGAAALLNEVLQNEPDNVAAMRLLAAAFLQLRRPEDAVPIIEKLIKLRPADAENHILMALTALTREWIGLAAEQYAEARALMPDPKAMPQIFRAHIVKLMMDQRRPSSLKAKGFTPISLESIDRFAEGLFGVKLESDASPFRDFPETLIQRAHSFAQQGAYDDALLVLRLVVSDRKAGGTEAVADKVRKASQSQKDNAACRHLLARFYLSQNDPQAADREWKALLEAHPDHQVAAITWAAEFVNRGDCGQAQRILREARKHNKDSVWLANSLAWSLAVDPNADTLAAEEAVELAEWVCRQVSEPEPAFLDTLATAHAAAGNFEKAVENEQKAIQTAMMRFRTESMNEYRSRLRLFEMKGAYKIDRPEASKK